MEALSDNQKAKLNLLELSLGVHPGEAMSELETATNLAVCASLVREEQLQFSFMRLYQWLIFAFSSFVFILLVFAGWRIINSESGEAVAAGAGALVSGAAATFLLRRLKDSRDAHKAAQAGLEKHQCPQL